jgi:hypothetical protein
MGYVWPVARLLGNLDADNQYNDDHSNVLDGVSDSEHTEQGESRSPDKVG